MKRVPPLRRTRAAIDELLATRGACLGNAQRPPEMTMAAPGWHWESDKCALPGSTVGAGVVVRIPAVR